MNSKQQELLEKARATSSNEGYATISLLQRRLRIGFGQAADLLKTLSALGVLGSRNPNGMYYTVPSLQAKDQLSSVESVHVRILHDLALYLLENHLQENTVCVRILAEPFVADRNELRSLVKAAKELQPADPLFHVAVALAKLPNFSKTIAFSTVHHQLEVECAKTELWARSGSSAMEARMRGLFHAMRYLKRRSLQGLAPHSRAIEVFVHRSLWPDGKGLTSNSLYREHVVPCVLVQQKATELLNAGVTEQVVAAWIEPYIRIVKIAQHYAQRLDGPMGLKTSMPQGWDFESGCIYARLHQLDIGFRPPEEGPVCGCSDHAHIEDRLLIKTD